MAAPATAGWVKASGSYTVYAKATDAGSPASGIAAVTADVSAITPGQTALALTSCVSSCTVGGVTYTWKSAATAAGSPLADGSKSFSVTARDAATNAAERELHGHRRQHGSRRDRRRDREQHAELRRLRQAQHRLRRLRQRHGHRRACDGHGERLQSHLGRRPRWRCRRVRRAAPRAASPTPTRARRRRRARAIAQGATPFSVTATDKAANATTGSYSVTVDSTGPTVSGVAIANTTTSTRRPDQEERRLHRLRQRVRRRRASRR